MVQLRANKGAFLAKEIGHESRKLDVNTDGEYLRVGGQPGPRWASQVSSGPAGRWYPFPPIRYVRPVGGIPSHLYAMYGRGPVVAGLGVEEAAVHRDGM